MKRILDFMLNAIEIVFLALRAFVMSVIFWWPIIAIAICIVLGMAFISNTVAIVFASIFVLFFLFVMIIKIIDASKY